MQDSPAAGPRTVCQDVTVECVRPVQRTVLKQETVIVCKPVQSTEWKECHTKVCKQVQQVQIANAWRRSARRFTNSR